MLIPTTRGNPVPPVTPVTNAELKRFLLHDDIMVRESIAFYLFESWSPDDDLIPLVLEGCRLYGEESSFATLGHACRFRFSTGAFLDAVQELERSQPRGVEEWLSRAPLGLIQSHADLLRTVVSLNTMARIERRRAFSGMPTSKLWRRLNAAAHRFDVQGSDREEQHELEDLQEALANRETRQAVVEKVRELDQLPGPCLKTCLVELAGTMKLHEVTRALVERLGDPDDDVLAEAAAKSLSRLGAPSVVQQIRAQYPDKPWDFRLFAIGALQPIKTTNAETTLYALLEIEDDPALRGRIFDALRFHFTQEAASRMREEIRERSSWMLDDELKKALYVNAVILGRDDPEAKAWVFEDDDVAEDGILFHIPVMDLGEGPLE